MLKEFIDVDNQWQQALQAVYHYFPVTSFSPGCIQSITSYRHNGVKFFIEECTVVLGSRKPDDRWTNYRVPAEFSSFQAVTCHSSKEKIYVYIALPFMPRSSKWSQPSRFPNYNVVQISHPLILTICPTCLIFRGFITVIWRRSTNLWSFSLRSFVPILMAPFSLCYVQLFFSALSNIFNLVRSLKWEITKDSPI
jgi:hypothetical protein